MSFQTQVEDIVGVSISDTSALSDFLTASAREVADILPKEALLHNATIDETTTDSSGYNAENKRILDIARNGRLSVEAPFGISTQLETSSGSIYEASIRSPFHYYKGKTIFIKPDPTSSQKGQIFAFAYPTVLYSGTTGIASFPDNAEFAVVLGASSKYLFRMTSDEIDSAPAVLSISDLSISASAPTAPSLQSNAVAFSETAPAYSKPTISLSNAPSISDLSIGVTAPTAPSLSSSTVSFSETAPTYTKPEISLAPAPSITALNISDTTPEAPVLADSEVSFSTTAPTYASPVLSLEALTISDLSISSALPVSPSLSDNSISFSASAPTYTAPVISPDFSDANTWLNTEEDSEMVSSRMQVISGQLQEYQADIQSAVNTFNKENAQYQAELQKATEDARLSSQDDGQKLQKYGSEIQSYQADINKEIQEYQANFQKDLQLWQIKRQTDLQKYGSEIQNSLNSFNKENAEYQAQLQISIQEAQLLSQDDAQKIQNFSASVSAYQSSVSKQVQQFKENTQQEISIWQTKRQTELQQFPSDIQNELNEFNKENVAYQAELQKAIETGRLGSQDDVQKVQKYSGDVALYQAEVADKVQEYSQNLKKEIDIWQTKRQTELQQYSTDIQNELNEFNKENVEYQAKLQEAIEEGRLSSQDDVQAVQKYAQEIGSYGASINKEVQEYQANLSQNVQEAGANLQRSQFKTQALQQQYQLCEAKYQAELARLSKK